YPEQMKTGPHGVFFFKCRLVFLIGTSFAFTTTSSTTLGFDRNHHRNVSELLDNLLRGYDNSIRPGFGGPPAVVEVDIMVRSMGPISEVDMTYSMDCYFRQSWLDRRLAYAGYKDTLRVSITKLEKIWKPTPISTMASRATCTPSLRPTSLSGSTRTGPYYTHPAYTPV
ncbi:hypothetical protein LSTR_LSTR014306, partial [Laodelphax striatellus]